MAFETPPLPNFNVAPPQIANPLDQYARAAALRNMLSETSLRQQLAPLDVQEAQARAQSAQIQTQLQRIGLENAQIAQSAWNDPKMRENFDNWQKEHPSIGTETGTEGPVALHPFAQFLADTKGLPLIGPNGALELSTGLMGTAQKAAELAKTEGDAGLAKLKAHSDQIDNFTNLAEPILNQKDPQKQADGLLYLRNEIIAHPDLYPVEAKQHLDTMQTVPGLAQALNTAKVVEMQVDQATKLATEKKTELETAPVSQDRLGTFNKIITSFGALRPEQKNAFISEAGTARTVDELTKIEERADATDKAEQMHRDSLAQTAALKGVTFAQKGLEANDKTWTDPQHGYLQTLAQANLGKASIKAGANGNGLLTSLEPTMVVLGMNSFAGVHRISPAEATAAGAPGGWAERFTAWADKAAVGKISPQLAKEGQELFDQLIDSKYSASVQASQMHAKGYSISPQNMPAMDREGNLTTLDKVGAPKSSGKTYTQADVDAAVASHPGMTAAQIESAFKAKNYTKH